ncbi:hypoxanthine phosphoribosyltransferase [Halodesulfurarchaeum sp.]|uniref:hypoxanthine phosphoribosyltransferase n=1 Tax=Halodesulfurarchaeum sp. TaxID=1980530 RepID=UPI002FC29723
MVSDPIDIRDQNSYTTDQFIVQEAFKPDLKQILISEGEIVSRISRMAEKISESTTKRVESELYAACVLKGALRFFGTLTPKLSPTGEYSEGVIHASRYTEGKTTETRAEVSVPERKTIEGKDVLIVEDIIDEGYTLESIVENISAQDPSSVSIAVLFDKRDRRKVEIDIDYTGFIVPDEFLVGYGLDYNERYRNLDHLASLDSSVLKG